MKLKLPKLNFLAPLFKLRYLYAIVIILALILFSYLGYFLYQYLYQTVTQSEKIILLKTEVAPDTINMSDVNSIIEFIDKKSAPKNTNWGEIRNPFLAVTAEPILPQPAKTATSTSY